MDRERLKQVQRTDMTESRVNEDFLDWLKNKGPTWLLIVLVAFTVYLGLVRWRTSQHVQQVQAWRALDEAQASAFPASLESVASDYPHTDAVAVVARISAAQILMESVLTNTAPGAQVDEETQALPPEDRELYLNRADRLFQEVIAADDGSFGMTLHAVNALNGRAAVAEARGDADAAEQHYLAAAKRAEEYYPYLAQQARERAEGGAVTVIELPHDEQVLTPAPASLREQRPATVDPALRDLLYPQDG